MMKPSIGIAFKFWFHKYYWILVCLGFVGLILWIVLIRPIDSVMAGAIITGLLSFTFFIQKQKLEELKLFSELFSKFNEDYDDLNSKLNEIFDKGSEPLDTKDKQILYDYFNLCAEEYFYFSKGYIPIEVWKAWNNGMKYYYQNKAIKELWIEDLKQNSYYGFSGKQLE
jgi:hypothetical protein